MYRLFNENSGENHYTKDEGERDYLDEIGWNYESIAFYSDDNKGVPFLRYYIYPGTNSSLTTEYKLA